MNFKQVGFKLFIKFNYLLTPEHVVGNFSLDREFRVTACEYWEYSIETASININLKKYYES